MDIDHSSKPKEDLNPNCLKTLKKKSQGYPKPISFGNVDMPSGFQT